MNEWLPSFADEFVKIAVLSGEDEKRQALQFAGLGGVAAPLISGAKNLISYGKVSPFGKLKRWLPAQIAGGALTGGALPTIRHALERKNVRLSKAREDVQKELGQLQSQGVNLPVVSDA